MDCDERLGWQHKGLPPGREVMLGDLGGLGWNVLAGDTGTPAALLRTGPLARNLDVMAEFCRRHDVWLAPHAKTHMSPELAAMQVAAGAWGLTAAAPHQVAALREFGVQRILLANELTDPGALRWAADLLAEPAPPELIWYVDSETGVRMAEEALPARPAGQRARVLVEVGHRGGRTGARTREQALAVAEAAHASDRLDLVGVAGFEGTFTAGPTPVAPLRAGQPRPAGRHPSGGHLPPAAADPGEAPARDPRAGAALAAVDGFLHLIRDVFSAAHAAGLFLADCQPIVSAGGSMYFDRVVDAFGPLRAEGAAIVLRSGCYLSHDDGLYDATSPVHAPGWALSEFESAIEVCGRVLSRPEPELALVNFGRRDVSFDAGLPTPRWFCPRGSGRARPAADLAVTGLSDQHAFIRTPPGHPIAAGDLLGVGISHPCTTFDRWRLLLLTDDSYRVTGGVRTFF